MRIVFTLICIVSALITEGNCLKCAECLGFSPWPCSEPISECPGSDDRCKTISYDLFTSVTNRTHFILRYCGNGSFCDEEQVLRAMDKQIYIYTSCCDEDTCTPLQKPQIERNITLNGLECPTCYKEMANNCEPEGKVKCEGDENYCVASHIVIGTEGSIGAPRECDTTFCARVMWLYDPKARALPSSSE
ncbi:phospholipase A2 inhibitor and Ly6/PLAUR domain-containing protein-like [Discoglossus pictus]